MAILFPVDKTSADRRSSRRWESALYQTHEHSLTNIARLADAILPEDRRTRPPTTQLKLYLPGLGTGEELFVGAVKVLNYSVSSCFVQADAFAMCRVLTATDCSRKYDSRTISSHRTGCQGTRFVRFLRRFAWVGETDCKSHRYICSGFRVAHTQSACCPLFWTQLGSSRQGRTSTSFRG